MEDDEMFNTGFDPYEILQEHDVMINRLVKAHNAGDTLIRELTISNQKLSELLVHTNQRTEKLEEELNRLYVYIGEQIQ